MPRYGILHHQMPDGSDRTAHWDLMFERDGVLWTWALSAEPIQRQTAQRLADHRLAYLDYEGPVSGNRGYVSRWDSGEYIARDIAEGRVLVSLSGKRLHGEVELRRHANGDSWAYKFADHASTPPDLD